MNPSFVKPYRTFLVVLTVIVLGVTGYGVTVYEAPEPAYYPLGVSSGAVREVFEAQGFVFEPANAYGETSQELGVSPDGAAVIQLIGDPDDLVGVNIGIYATVGMPEQTQDRRRDYLYTMIDVVLPEWEEGHDWFKDRALTMKRAGRRSTSFGDVDVTVVATEAGDGVTLSLLFGAQSRAPRYRDGVWETD